MNKEELAKFVAFASQEAWRRDTHTTVNSMIESVVLQVAEKLLEEINILQAFAEEIPILYARIEELKVKPKGTKNGS